MTSKYEPESKEQMHRTANASLDDQYLSENHSSYSDEGSKFERSISFKPKPTVPTPRPFTGKTTNQMTYRGFSVKPSTPFYPVALTQSVHDEDRSFATESQSSFQGKNTVARSSFAPKVRLPSPKVFDGTSLYSQDFVSKREKPSTPFYPAAAQVMHDEDRSFETEARASYHVGVGEGYLGRASCRPLLRANHSGAFESETTSRHDYCQYIGARPSTSFASSAKPTLGTLGPDNYNSADIMQTTSQIEYGAKQAEAVKNYAPRPQMPPKRTLDAVTTSQLAFGKSSPIKTQ